ncbi:MAG: hypothetical protein LBU99_04735 [Spirochaetaceae bacterium]|jgi:hypothetical protein|nr:hypothetical protein [Spirochaetaceae bacterium]
MSDPGYTFANLSTRKGFNRNVRHIKNTIQILDLCENNTNIADEINQLILKKTFDSNEISAVARMLLADRWNYSVISRNLTAVPVKIAEITKELSKWKAVDITFVYHDPDIGSIVINPKNPEHSDILAHLRKNELLIVYCGFLGDETKNNPAFKAISDLACEKCLDLIENRKVTAPAELLKGPFKAPVPQKEPASPKASASQKASVVREKASGGKATGRGKSAAAQDEAKTVKTAAVKTAGRKPAASGESFSFAKDAPGVASSVGESEKPAAVVSSETSSLRRVTPMVSVPVTNELFHNGNVEAWKRIIDSYTWKYPQLQIFVYYDGERITDINTLFKWGKVKHGSSIQFAVAGENPQDVAKLKRYFMQGASPRFEAFLHGAPGTIMKLF